MLCTSPSDVARTIMRSAFMKRNTSARPAPFNSKLTMAPYMPCGSRRRISAASGCAGSAGKYTRSTPPCDASHEATRQAFAHCRSMRNGSVLMPRIVR